LYLVVQRANSESHAATLETESRSTEFPSPPNYDETSDQSQVDTVDFNRFNENSVSFIGNVASDPKFVTLENGYVTAEMDIAVKQGKFKDGQPMWYAHVATW
jgi:hypothetical protein